VTVLLIVLGIVGVALLYVVLTYNGLVRLRNRVEAAWAQIDVQLKRRYDLIPNLVETVKAYAAHEQATLQAVVEARNRAMAAPTGSHEQAAAENVVTGALRQLFALSEAYPDLKANQGFLGLQEELTASEDKIAYARQFFNDSVLRFNNKIEAFPALLFATAFGFVQREFFEVDGDERGPVAVRF